MSNFVDDLLAGTRYTHIMEMDPEGIRENIESTVRPWGSDSSGLFLCSFICLILFQALRLVLLFRPGLIGGGREEGI